MGTLARLSLPLLLCGQALAEPAYFVFDDTPLKGPYFYSQASYTGPSWVGHQQQKLPCVQQPAYSPGASLEVRYVSAPGGQWQARIERHPLRGLDEWDNGVFIQARRSPYEKPTHLRLRLKGPCQQPPQVALLLDREKNVSGPWSDLPAIGADWQLVEIPLALERAEQVQGIVLRQGGASTQTQVLYVDDVEVVGKGSAPTLRAPEMTAQGGPRHIDLSWSASGYKRAWIERARPGGQFEGLGVRPAWMTRFVDFTQGEGPFRYRLRLENYAGEVGPPSPEVVGQCRPRDLLDVVQEASLRYYWEGCEPHSGLAVENRPGDPHMVAVGASGFGLMALLVGAERGFLERSAVLKRYQMVLNFLEKADRFHGVFPHYLDGRTGKIVTFFGPDDNGGDLVETSFLMQGLLCARQYFDGPDPAEKELRERITRLWEAVEWDHHRSPSDPDYLLWHWSPDKGYKINHPLVGWNETMITYLLAVASPTHAVPASLYSTGWAGQSKRAQEYRGGRDGKMYSNGKSYHGLPLDVGVLNGGPLFFTHYSFLGMDPRGMRDAFTDYFHNNQTIAEINRRYCQEAGYPESTWGLTASDGPWGYHPDEPLPELDKGKMTPTGALASMPYLPEASQAALRHYYENEGHFLWGEYGFRDAYSRKMHWVNDLYMGLNQAPIVVMIENHRSGLLWKLFGRNPEIAKMRGQLFSR